MARCSTSIRAGPGGCARSPSWMPSTARARASRSISAGPTWTSTNRTRSRLRVAASWSSTGPSPSAMLRWGRKASPTARFPCSRSCERLEACNHRRPQSPWVLWNWRDASRPVRDDSMWGEVRKLERRAVVGRVISRAFHGLRRALATALVEQFGVAQAARWIGDRPEVLLRRYVKPGVSPCVRCRAIHAL